MEQTSTRPQNLSRETLGKFFYDLAKIVFTSLVAGSIVSLAMQSPRLIYWVFIVIGTLVTGILSYIGFRIIE